MTLNILGQANGVQFRNLKHQGMRQGCHCIESRDIGAYDTCLNGCKYCYANTNRQKAVKITNSMTRTLRLLGHLLPSDTVQQGCKGAF
ncbi:MAG: DUF1848 family protein [Akkermansia sp.]